MDNNTKTKYPTKYYLMGYATGKKTHIGVSMVDEREGANEGRYYKPRSQCNGNTHRAFPIRCIIDNKSVLYSYNRYDIEALINCERCING